MVYPEETINVGEITNKVEELLKNPNISRINIMQDANGQFWISWWEL